jgi:hypothetical protein
MTRFAEPPPTGRPPAAGVGRPYVAGQQGVNTLRGPRRGRFSTLFIFLGIALLIGVVAGFLYFAHRNHWIDLSGSPSPRSMEKATVIFSGQASALSAASGNTIQADPSDPSIVWIRSSLTSANSNGPTGGVSVKVPSALSGELGAKRIRVTVSAGRSNTDALPPFAAAYSTGGAGNSGWFVFEPTHSFKDFSFNYVVPGGAAGLTHYVGIWSDIGGQNTPLAILSVTITILP